MSKVQWQTMATTIPLEDIKKVSSATQESYDEFEKSLTATGVDIDDFASTVEGSDFWHIENASITDEFEDMDPEEIFSLIQAKWNDFAKVVMIETGLEVSLYYPDAAIVDEERRNVYCVVENATIPNPAVEGAILDKISQECFCFLA